MASLERTALARVLLTIAKPFETKMQFQAPQESGEGRSTTRRASFHLRWMEQSSHCAAPAKAERTIRSSHVGRCLAGAVGFCSCCLRPSRGALAALLSLLSRATGALGPWGRPVGLFGVLVRSGRPGLGLQAEAPEWPWLRGRPLLVGRVPCTRRASACAISSASITNKSSTQQQ